MGSEPELFGVFDDLVRFEFHFRFVGVDDDFNDGGFVRKAQGVFVCALDIEGRALEEVTRKWSEANADVGEGFWLRPVLFAVGPVTCKETRQVESVRGY